MMGVNELLESFREGTISLDETLVLLKEQGIEDLGFAKIDTSRFGRTGIPEVIYSSGKTKEQVRHITERMYKAGIDILWIGACFLGPNIYKLPVCMSIKTQCHLPMEEDVFP